MAHDIQSMLDELHANPFSKDTRLILADMLDENGDAERAEILRRGHIPMFEDDIEAAEAMKIDYSQQQLDPNSWCWLWIICHRRREFVASKRIKKLAKQRHRALQKMCGIYFPLIEKTARKRTKIKVKIACPACGVCVQSASEMEIHVWEVHCMRGKTIEWQQIDYLRTGKNYTTGGCFCGFFCHWSEGEFADHVREFGGVMAHMQEAIKNGTLLLTTVPPVAPA